MVLSTSVGHTCTKDSGGEGGRGESWDETTVCVDEADKACSQTLYSIYSCVCWGGVGGGDVGTMLCVASV